MLYATLEDRAVIRLSGGDRITFLQGLITNDATKLAQGSPLYAALLSPQGKFLHDFFLIPQAEHILLDVNNDRAADLLARLSLYRLRSKITMETTALKVTALWDSPAAPPHPIIIADPRLPALGWRIYGEPDIAGATPGDYEAHRIRLGVPDGAKDMHIDKSLLLEGDFETLHGVSFAKGCYVGQEVTARSKFRGQLRKRLYAVEATKALPDTGSVIHCNGVEIGELRSVSGHYGLALLRNDLMEGNAEPLMAGDVALTLSPAHS